jgi:hypothetical protein
VFIDETAASTKMVRLNGRCPRGVRLIGHAPHGHWKTITFVAGLRNDGMVARRVKKLKTAQRRQFSNFFGSGRVLHNKLAVDA